MQRLRIGFVGVGNMGQAAHLRNYAALRAECEVIALAELRLELGRRVARRYAIPEVYTDHRRMLENERLDGIVASQPFTRHGVLVPELLQSGVPVFTEKPLAGSIAVGERIAAAAQQSSGFLMIGYHKRCDAATEWARGKIEALKASGELGPMRYIRITMPPGDWVDNGFAELLTSDERLPPLEGDPPDADMTEPQYRAYISFVNYYIHQVNLMRFLLGEGYHVTHADHGGGLLVGRSESGIACSIEMAPYHTSRGWEERALVCFERGYIDLQLPAPLALNRAGTVELYSDPADSPDGPQRLSPTLPPEHAMLRQARHFLRAIRGEAPPPCDAAEALQDLNIARDYRNLIDAATT